MTIFLLQAACFDHPRSNEVYGVYTSRQKAEEAYKKLMGQDLLGNDYCDTIEEMELDVPAIERGISS